jgi:oxygen-independent coproporphyrinogen-3 oxidase
VLPRHLYVHVPFCTRRCSYCDFSIAVRRIVPVGEYVAAVRAELAVRFPAGKPWAVDTVYLGGGTPSRLGPAGVACLIEAIRSRVTLAAAAEVTLEVNPEDVTTDAVLTWRDAGVNRVSIGAQSFDDRVLAWMRRTHVAARTVTAVEAVRAAGIDNVSLDLIFALPAVLERSWDADLARALELEPSHVSLYGLTVEHATPLGRWVARGQVAEPPEERYESEFLRAHDAMGSAGLEHYEVSNFARAGRRSRHNSAYWSAVPYAGIGPAAHGFDGTQRRWNAGPYEEWRRRLARSEDPVDGVEVLTDENRLTERVYLGLRTTAGLRLTNAELPSVRPWIESGWATLEGDRRLVLQAPGWLRLDALASALTASRSLC